MCITELIMPFSASNLTVKRVFSKLQTVLPDKSFCIKHEGIVPDK